MTKYEFIAICEEHSIDPCIALENESITKTLGAALDNNILAKAKITLILEEEF
jgi:hypothetical protein